MKPQSRLLAALLGISLAGCSGLSGSTLRNEGPSALMGPRKIISSGVVGARGLAVADLDSDGYVDVLATSEYEGEVFWFRNENGAGFADGVVVTDTFDSALTVNAADLTGDGLPDVVVGGDQRVEWYENLGGGKLAAGRSLSDDLPKIIRVSSSDLDSDGDIDVISASKFKVSWFENRGAGSFAPPVVVNSDVKHVNWTDAADLNVDGRPDIFAISYEYEYPEIKDDPSLPGRAERGDNLVWHENLGGGKFGPAQMIYGKPGIIQSHTRAGDLDGDGRQDLISCHLQTDQILWFRNEPGGISPEPRVVTASSDGPEALIPVDIDVDGDMDVVSVSIFSGGMVELHRNRGSGSFDETVVLARNVSGATAVEVADFDHDGDMDVVAVAETENSVFWFESTKRMREK